MTPRNYLTLALLAVIAILCIRDCSSQEKIREGQNAQELLGHQNERIRYLVNDSQQVIARVKTLVATEKNAQILLKENAELRKRVGKLSRVKTFTDVGFTASGVLHDTIYVSQTAFEDSAWTRHWTKTDGYLSLDLSFKMSDSALIGDIWYTYSDSVQVVIHEQKKYRWWWKQGPWWKVWNITERTMYTDVMFQNKNARAGSIKSIFNKD